ncbi:MAG: hypothetical protein E6772_15695 [Dysgonomonas sp.]|nr:hypothetical protein [Dysgonomonas sp.]
MKKLHQTTDIDTAFILKREYDKGQMDNYHVAEKYLEKSLLVAQLLDSDNFDALSLLYRLTELSEIPFTYEIPKVKVWLQTLVDMTFCGEGFSLTKNTDYILSCYNSMITSILIKLQYAETNKIEKGIEWILNYQHTKRGQKNNWKGTGVLKYGGCMKSTPCYIGVVKAMIALSDYRKQKSYLPNIVLEEKLNEGLEYILSHAVYKRLSTDAPITKDIVKLTYPFSYKVNILEILRLLNDNELLHDKRCDSAKEYLISKKKKIGMWHPSSIYTHKDWQPFDRVGKPGVWLSHEIEKLLI